MPNLGSMHPYVVHMVIGLCLIGVAFRVVSLSGKWQWMNPTATLLLLFAAVAGYAGVKSGTDAHGPVERMPGARTAVQEHEEWGERTRNLFFAIAALELVGLFLAADKKKFAYYGSAALGLAGVFAVVETGEHGGELVYSYAGGVGIRTGSPDDVSRLLLAGMYQQAMLDRKAGKGAEAAQLIGDMQRRWPSDESIKMLAIESMFRDSGNPAGAIAALDSLQAPAENPRMKRTIASMKADAFIAAGMKDSARTIVESLLKEMPGNPRLQAKLDSLK